jgi:hypothetical protein
VGAAPTGTHLRHYIGIHDGHRTGLFVYFKASFQDVEGWVQRFESVSVEARSSRNGAAVRVTLLPQDFERSTPLLTDLLHAAVAEYEA